MEPLIADESLVIADVSEYNMTLRHIKEGQVYVICWDLDEDECAVKYLRCV